MPAAPLEIFVCAAGKRKAGKRLPMAPTRNSVFHRLKWTYTFRVNNSGVNTRAVMPNRKQATCTGEYACNPFLIRMYEDPQIIERSINATHPIRVGALFSELEGGIFWVINLVSRETALM